MVKKPQLKSVMSMGGRAMASISDQAAAAAVSFAVSIFVGRHIGVDALGIYAITNVFILLFRAFQNCLVLEPMSVFGPRVSENYKEYFGFLVRIEIICVFAASLLLALGATVAHALAYIEDNLFFAMLASCIYLNLVCFQYFLRRQFYVDHRQYLATIQSFSFLFLVIAGLAILWRVDGLSVVDIYMLLAGCSIVVCIIQGGRFWSQMGRPSAHNARNYLRHHWSYGKWMLMAVPFSILTYQGFFAIVGFAISSEAAGLLKAAEVFIGPFAQIVIGLQLMLVPMASRTVDKMSLAQQKRFAMGIGLLFLSGSLVYAGIVYFAREYAVLMFFGEHMRDAIPILAILALLPIFRGLPTAAGVILAARKQANLRFVSQASSTILSLMAAIPMIYYGGVLGAAAAMVMSQAVFAITNWACVLWLWRRDKLSGVEAVATAT